MTLRWRIALLVAVAIAISYLERQALTQGEGPLRGLDENAAGLGLTVNEAALARFDVTE